jgi:hypothetical protein
VLKCADFFGVIFGWTQGLHFLQGLIDLSRVLISASMTQRPSGYISACLDVVWCMCRYKKHNDCSCDDERGTAPRLHTEELWVGHRVGHIYRPRNPHPDECCCSSAQAGCAKPVLDCLWCVFVLNIKSPWGEFCWLACSDIPKTLENHFVRASSSGVAFPTPPPFICLFFLPFLGARAHACACTCLFFYIYIYFFY